MAICFTTYAEEPWAGGPTGGGNDAGNSNFTNDQTIMSPGLRKQLQEREKVLNGETSGNSLSGLHNLQSQLPKGQNQKGKPKVSLREQAFSNLVSSSLPMTPTEIVRLHSLFNATQRAAATIPGVPPKPVSRNLIVNLSPGSTPPVIRLYAGFVSTLVFVDSTGAPWPIEAYDLGNPKAFNISWNKTNNMMMIQALTVATVANLMVKLRNEQTPIMLTLIPDQRAVDYRVDLRVPGLGPDAKALPTGDGLPDAANPILLNILNGVAPIGSKVLDVGGADCQAWLVKKKLYLRTRFKVLSPGWLATMTSADGTNAYELERTPYVLLTGHGKTIPLKISGF